MLTVGVDGCPAGWLAVALRTPAGCADLSRLSLSWAVHRDAASLFGADWASQAEQVLIDVPIGLSDGPPRRCDREARLRLGPRRASVFTPPMRAMLAMQTRQAASDYGQSVRKGGGLSAQAWNIVPKIAEIDEAMLPHLQSRWREGHPELAFARMAGQPMDWPKRTKRGLSERLAVLGRRGVDMVTSLDALRAVRPKPASADDLVDAAVLALAARDLARGDAWVLGGDRDARGLRMEIVG